MNVNGLLELDANKRDARGLFVDTRCRLHIDVQSPDTRRRELDTSGAVAVDGIGWVVDETDHEQLLCSVTFASDSDLVADANSEPLGRFDA